MKFFKIEKEKEKKLLYSKIDEKSSHDANIKQYENKIIELKDKEILFMLLLHHRCSKIIILLQSES